MSKPILHDDVTQLKHSPYNGDDGGEGEPIEFENGLEVNGSGSGAGKRKKKRELIAGLGSIIFLYSITITITTNSNLQL